MPPRSYRKLSDLPGLIPVFPLRGAILLPRATLPLNVFEPRYLVMVDAVLSGGRVLGIVQPAGGGEQSESPEGKSAPLQHVGCAGRLTAYQELDDGRVVITLTGIARFHITGEPSTDQPYRTCRVDYRRYGDDLTQDCGAESVDRARLLAVLKAYMHVQQLRGDWRAIANAPLEALINTLCVVSPFGAQEKQALLEAPDLVTRADTLIALAEMTIAAGGSGGAGTLQ